MKKLGLAQTFTNDKSHKVTENLQPVGKIEYENLNLKEIVETAVKALQLKDVQKEAFITFAGVSLINLANRIPLDRLANIGYEMNNNPIMKNAEIFTGANFNNLGLFSLGVGPAVSSSILVSLLKEIFPKLKEELSGIYGEGKARKIQRGLTFILAIMQSTMLVTMTNGGVVLATVLAIGAVLIGEFANYMSKNGLCSGTGAIIGSNIAGNLATSGTKSLLLTPLMLGSLTKLQTAHVKVKTINRKKRENHIPFKIFSNGTLPIILASSLISTVAVFFPTLMSQYSNVVLAVQSVLIFVINYCCSIANPATREVHKTLVKKNMTVKGFKSGFHAKPFLDKVNNSAAILSGLMLAVMGALPMITGGAVVANISSIFILGGVVLEIIRKLESKVVFHKKYSIFVS